MPPLRNSIASAIACLALTSAADRPAFARITWTEIAYIQVLEGPGEVWVFAGVDRVTDYSDEPFARLMSARPRRTVARLLVFTVDARGKVTSREIPAATGLSFHPNLSLIYRDSDGFGLYSRASMGRPMALYRWRGDGFVPLPEGEARGDAEAVATRASAKIGGFLDDLTEKSGWRRWSGRAFMLEAEGGFRSEAHKLRVSTRQEHTPGRTSAILVESTSEVGPWSLELLGVETRGERERHVNPLRR